MLGRQYEGNMATDPRTLRRGIYRSANPSPLEHDVQVQDVNGGSDMPLPESIYRARGYEPPFDELPWRDEYFAARDA